ncbi:SDR family oxidoreductase [Mycobacterium intracellulare]|uniref:Clavaldehyde dehydrogenase n=1 Tax=Mycobacterium intracellulare subsp. chimaera TaxID=222805 RepID=A0A220YAA0_MYCIT|nr:SDR family oxidoreductase [Mycobacterium intracellulare]AOS91650.1 oxidoreductase [Mycobacterium intracellulare subsp. chimaera]ARV81722.1 oxidoreductase [Mycobacterium intracellulare subsp. chimaera]ASL08822.1 clavaldehyde dehydrogenase [Mycobacterium intracellulare subsp. chimaera]ASL14481.1 clavaldehyde dehydrogenase [Mycobacterium intracellulare subsp. chimaera]ASL20604.1 clavaldehyde dehydrogenase [Mycobacterium intracellulare subsp. chimaera]
MSDRHSNIAGTRMLIIGASSGIGQALALAAHSRGAAVALAARRVDRLSELADRLGGSAHELDVSDPRAIESVVNAVAAHFGKLDAVVFTSAVVPFALIEDTDVETWLHAYAVNAVGASHVLRTALPHLADNATVVVASSHDVGRPRAGVAAYHASKAALDEILRSWRAEHPEIAVIRVSVGPTCDTEILRGADRDLLADLYRSWEHGGQIPDEMSTVEDVAHAMLSLVAISRANPTVVSEIVHLAPRIIKGQQAFTGNR